MQAALLPPLHPELCAPITSNRELGACLVANVPMHDLLAAELRRAGVLLVEPQNADNATLRIPIGHWLEVGALVLLDGTPNPACLLDGEGRVLAWKGCAQPEDCGEKIVTTAECFPVIYPWDLLRLNEAVLALLDESSLACEVGPLVTISGVVRIGAGTTILPGTVIEGPVIIGPNCRIGPNAHIRGATSIGAHCRVGNGAEVHNSVIYPHGTISAQCSVAHSIIGAHAFLGAGTSTDHHRHDGRYHLATIHGKEFNTGRLNLGAMLGDGVCTGANTTIAAGVSIGLARMIPPGTVVSKDLM